MSHCARWFVYALFFPFCVATVQAGGVMQIQLPFYDGDAHECMQNSNDTPTHQYQSTFYDLDFAMDVGTILVATAEGTFGYGDDPSGFGCYVKVDHGNGYWTMMGHTSGRIAQDGQHVVAGQPIAYSGGKKGAVCSGRSTGPHVHVGIHNGNGVGISQSIDMWAYDQKTGSLDFFTTEIQSELSCRIMTADGSAVVSYGHTYESRPIGKTFSDFSCRKLSGSSGVLCWYLNPTTCEDGSDHVRYFRNARGSMESESNVDTWRWCLEDTGQSANVFSFLEGGYGVGGDDSGSSPPPSTPLPNLQIEEITVHTYPEGSGTKLVEGTTLMNVGETYQVNVWPVSKEEHCQNGNATGNEDFEVKTDTFYKYARSKDEGDWQFLKRSETHCKYMVEDDSKKEMITFTVPVDAAGKRFYLKSKVDAPGNIFESNEDDNWSDVEWYPIVGNSGGSSDICNTKAGEYDENCIPMYLKTIRHRYR